MRPIKSLTPYGNRVLVAAPLSIASAVFFFYGMWAVPELAFGYFMLMFLAPAVILHTIIEEK